MKVVFDAPILAFLIKPDTPPPLDPLTNEPVTHCQARLQNLLTEFQRNQTVAIIPTPALAEVLVTAGNAAPAFMAEFNRPSARYRIEPFDALAAIELAEMTRIVLGAGDKRGGQEGTWAKVKFDRQIIAIARVHGASTIYSDDKNLRAFAQRCDLNVIGIAELPLPPETSQLTFDDIEDE